MRIHEKIEINRPPSVVWPFVEDPEQRRRWNDKFRGAVPLAGPLRKVGHTFNATYLMNGRELVCRAEIIDYDPPVRLRIRMESEAGGGAFRATEDYRLATTVAGTLFEQEIRVTMKINPLLRLLIWAVTRFGRPVEEPLLVGLKRLVETGETRAPRQRS